jgi:hypothetical protein
MPAMSTDTSGRGGQLFSLPADFDNDSDSTVDFPSFACTPPRTQSTVNNKQEPESLSMKASHRHQVTKNTKHKRTLASSSKQRRPLLLTDSESDVEIVERDVVDTVDLSQANSGHDGKGKGRASELQHYNNDVPDTLNDIG